MRALALAAAALLSVSITAGAQVRDRPNATSGTATISGSVMSDSQPPRPLRRASVLAFSSEGGRSRTAITDDAGRFSITNLPAGSYTLSAIKHGWVTAVHGAKAPGRPGRPIVVAEAERLTASLRMARAAVITGTVLDPNGLPPTGVAIRVLRYSYAFNTGERRLGPAPATAWGPDDRGTYRIWGLAPGEYYVAASPSGPGSGVGRDLHLTSDTDVEAAMRAAENASEPIRDVAQPPVGLSPVFYPGATSAAQAVPITVRAGEERAGIDFAIQFTPTAHVEGTVTSATESLPAGTQVNLVATDPAVPAFGFDLFRSARVVPGGRFEFPDVTPGHYIVAARASIPAPAPNMPAQALFASTEIDVAGEDVRGLSLPLQEGFSISGVVRLEGTAPPLNFAALRINLQPLLSAGGIAISSSASTIDAEGRFVINGIAPGAYRLTTFAPPQSAWTLRSSTIGGQDALDAALDIRQASDAAVITFTDRKSELKGRIEGSAADDTVLLFSPNQAHWTAPSRRVLTSRTASDGSYSFANVPPGEYLLTALDDVEPGEWYNPAFLQRAAATAIRITIAEGEKKTQDIHIGGG